MKKYKGLFWFSVLLLVMFSACKKENAGMSDNKTTETAQALSEKTTESQQAADNVDAKKDETAKPENAAPIDNKDAQDVKAADAEVTMKTIDMPNFKLVVPSNIDTTGKTVTVEKAADGIERALITSWEGKRTEQPWYIRLAEIGDVKGESCYIFDVAQSDSPEFVYLFRGAVSQTRNIYLFEKESGNWMHYGELSPDE